MRQFRKLVIAMAGLTAAAPALAHHSFAMFDTAKEVELTGTVKDYQWTNPHSWLQLNVPRGPATVEYSIEMGSPNTMSRHGWRRSTFKAGDKVTVTINPMRDGSPGGSLIAATDRDGKRLSMR